ncbi:reverse transcriptase domain-containing protein [Tanacetum coccineum]|uniref:Reverse transcriptase domain-containing protein n=1 Tax=Tanacetum coccineum TaxID=301880 RepID=A0ABQ5GIJ7_9ASTR
MHPRWTLGSPGQRSQDSQQQSEHPDVWLKDVRNVEIEWNKKESADPNPKKSRVSFPKITFSEDNPISQYYTGDDPLIITADIGTTQIHKVYVDGGSSTDIMYEHCFEQLLAEEKNIKGSGVGLILTDPNGQEVTYALRFNFRASNNEAEYEALVTGLEQAIKMQAQCLEELQGHFNNFTITQIPRSKNKRADALSKLASSSFAYLTKSVLVEVVPCRSIEFKAIHTIEEVGRLCSPSGTLAIMRCAHQTEKHRLESSKARPTEPQLVQEGCMSFSLVYGSEVVLPPEIGLPTYWINTFQPRPAPDRRFCLKKERGKQARRAKEVRPKLGRTVPNSGRKTNRDIRVSRHEGTPRSANVVHQQPKKIPSINSNY